MNKFKNMTYIEILNTCKEHKDKNWCNEYCSIKHADKCPEEDLKNNCDNCNDCNCQGTGSLSHHFEENNWIGEINGFNYKTIIKYNN